ncbi:MAG: hypothetical protein ACYC1Z_13875 [Georgenia sp.]
MPTVVPARIRPATVLDAVDVARVVGSAPAWEERLLEPGATTTWVADRGGEVVGVAVAKAAGPGAQRSLELEVLDVLATETDAATREHLLELAVGDAPCLVWVGDADQGAQEFFARHGFVPDGARSVAGAASPGEIRAGSGARIRMVR